ncbi:hypothetical protein EPN96_10290 [bacterium]|nr:MAG: hypothetical protein EPN96_10290 [bacterium]
MGKTNFFRATAVSLTFAALFLCATGASASMQTRVMRGFLQKVDVKGGIVYVVLSTHKGSRSFDFKLEKEAKVTFKGSPVDVKDLGKGTELLITYVPSGKLLTATDLKRVR